MKSHSQLVAVEIGSSEGPQNHASGSGCIKEHGVDTDVNVEEGISEQEGDMIVECGTCTPVIPSASASGIHNLIELVPELLFLVHPCHLYLVKSSYVFIF
ncbi:hypothetical protein ACFX16_030726 [Malus domestica]